MKKTVSSLAPVSARLSAFACLCVSLFASSIAWSQQSAPMTDAEGRTEHVEATAPHVHACREQARQRQLAGSERSRFLSACIKSAEEHGNPQDHESVGMVPMPHADAEGRNDDYAGVTRTARKACVEQAMQKQLQGESRTQFMRECVAKPPAMAEPTTPGKTIAVDAEGRPLINAGETSKQAAQCRQQARGKNLNGSALVGFLERCQSEAQRTNSAS